MGCGCGDIKTVSVVPVGGVSICAVSSGDLFSVIDKAEYVLTVKEHLYVRRQLVMLRKMSEQYGVVCPDEYNFNRIKNIVENEYSKYR